MDRRWIRIDRAHRTFDCSPREFDAVLVEARTEGDFSERNSQAFGSSDSNIGRMEADDFQLLEAINAELALLASLQRRERITKSEREQTEQTRERTEQGKMLADLHAASLRHE